jgi:signal transduction histidine kinase
MNRTPLTVAARRHMARLARALSPHLARLERDSTARLRQRPYDRLQIKAFLAITAGAFARLGSMRKFLEQVEYQGRRLAQLNVPPGEAAEMLRELETLLEPLIDGQFGPAREQLQLATILALNHAFYQVREAESQAFFGLSCAEAEAENLEDLLRGFVRIITRTFHASAGRLLLLNGGTDPKLMRPRYIQQGQAAEALIVDEAMRGRHASYWSFPLRPAVLVQLGFPSPYPWLPRERALLDAVGARCARAIERVRLEEEVRRLEAAGRHAEEEERRRIGRELHDEAGQALLLLRLQLEMMERDAPVPLARRLREARGIVEKTVDELRRIVAALSPEVLERLGLESALRHLAGRFQKMHPARLRLRIDKPATALASPVQQVIYRVAQECLQNIVKHSQASAVNLLLHSADQSIRLSVSDNGAGFYAERAWSKTMSFGLSGMRERATTLGGTLTVRSAPGKGARIVLSLPTGSDRSHDRKAAVSTQRELHSAVHNMTAATMGANGKNSRITH